MKPESLEIIACDFSNPLHREALVNLMNEYIADKMGGGEPYTDDQKIKLVQGLRDHPTSMVFFAITENSFVGLVNCFVNFATFTVKPFINIHDVIVTEKWRGKGVGRKMLERVIDEGRKIDCSKITLEVREDNKRARSLYQSLGFDDADPRQFYWAKFF